jgi:flavin-dependent dehydrogenase
MTQDQKTDVLVIGGGPAGTTIATLLARGGRQVTLLEKDQHPRFHIGESLLPMNLPILERLGVLDQVEKIGVKKLGADFTSSDRPGHYHTYLFANAMGESADHAFEVRRAEFDKILFENCRESGVDALENHQVTRVEMDQDGRHRVIARAPDGTDLSWAPDFLVDASGRDTMLARSNGWKLPNRKHASAAVFGHFHGVKRRPGDNAGNISVYWFEHGWIWMIPLQDELMSVGAVCWPDYLKQRKDDLDTFLAASIELCPAARRRMRSAQPANAARATGNYAYGSQKISGPGYLLIGDAYAFVDPVFSSGVYLAMSSAERGVELVETWLSGDKRRYRGLEKAHRKDIQRGLKSFSWFIYRFTSPAMRKLFKEPRNIFRVEQAVVSMLAGDVFRVGPVQRRLIIFRIIYAVSWLVSWKSSYRAWRQRIRNAKNELTWTS